jgi:signal transduction histidine kinase/CheY-like chemotaxis protein
VRYSARSVYDEQENFLYNEGIIEDITQRKEAEAQVSQLLEKEQQAREEAEAANRLKDEFLATLSHELRTPLNSILGWAQMLQRGTLSQKQTTKALSIIERNVRDQTKLVEDLLDVSRIVRGKMKLDLRLVDLYQVVNEALNMVRPTAEAKSIQLQILPPEPEILRINGDVDRLRQIIWNLLINAIKFTPNKGKVTVRLEQVEEMVMVHVTDTGIGIESDILPHVFDRFRQVDSSSRRRHGGLGIGLAIVRHLTELHGGSVTATSEGQDQGSTFSVKLPAAITQESEVNSPVVESATNLPQIAGIRVLVVDDEPDTLQLTTMILEEYEVQVTAVESVAQALQALETQTFDLMISDISMPEADGYDLIKSVRTSYPQMSAIALTAFASDRDRTTALETGFDLYLAKPIDADQLVEAVEELVKQ